MNRREPSASSSGQSFFTRIFARHKVDSNDSLADDAKGPFGLNTLFEPSISAVADLVFVHGLGGGSRSTWTKSLDKSLYWPQEWLPKDAGFQDVRIHSFGYHSNWGKESTLNIHDFAKSLLGSIHDSPHIPQGSSAPLILIGHSMGGLVIKKAYILARQMQGLESLARRVQTILFLATPHRGADLAQLLTRILSVTSGPRPFVTDLHRNSLATQSINDEFPQHCQDLQLYSFYETLPTSYGFGKGLIVDKDLATLGYPNERTAYLNANHRDICKYSTPSDPNYQTVRNALALTIENLRSRTSLQKRDLNSERHRLVDSTLGVSDAPHDDLMSVDARRMEGSCKWINKRQGFISWRDTAETQMYWICAKPGSGKSVLSGYIITHLKDLNRDNIFFFFQYGNRVRSTVSYLLRSIARQMAVMHGEVLKLVQEVCEKDDQLGKADYRTIWRKLFLDGILKIKFDRPQYWVIDALDECMSDSELVPLLLKAMEISSIRILVTSRNHFHSYGQTVHSKIKATSEEIMVDDTKSDIALYLEAIMDHLPSIDEQARQNMVNQILRKSAGCFLWVSLVLQELRQVHTSAEISHVLENVPSDMDELYSRILYSMSRAPYGKLLAKAILTWTVCSVRPLTIDELYHALQIDIKDTIDSVQKSITGSCGQLVYVDHQSRVQMVHQTACDFLLRPGIDSDFAIDKKSGHKQLAMTCLRYLNGNEMKGPGFRKLNVSNLIRKHCPFVSYACDSLFEHVMHVSSMDDDILIALAHFLNSSNVLSWIEHLARKSDLNRIIQTGKAFRNFLQRRSKHTSPFGWEVAILDSWATDLIRLITKFGTNLLASPSSIYYLIPPFCPPETALRKQFAASTRGIAVLGLSATTWDDCLSTIVYHHEQPLALACSDNHFAVGLSSGKVVVYHGMTCQETLILQHQEPVNLLQFGERREVLVSSGPKAVRVWDIISWQQRWKFDILQPSMSLTFTDGDRLLLGALRNNHLMIWDLTTGRLRDSTDWTQDLEGQSAHPTVAAFGMELSLLAVVYRGQDILIWDLERDALYEFYGKSTGAYSGERKVANSTVWSLVFSPAPAANLLAAAYSDGDLVLFDTFNGIVKETALVNAQALACSPDGRTLASGDSVGTIQLFEFDTLKIIYRFSSEEYGIRSLSFSGDSHRLHGIKGLQCQIWDPMVLAGHDHDEERSDTMFVSTAPKDIARDTVENAVLITAIALNESGEMIICGKEDGSIDIYQTRSSRQSQRLCSHALGVSIMSLIFDTESNIVSSTDSSSRVVSRIISHQQEAWVAAEPVLDYRVGVAVDQLLGNRGHTRLLVCSANEDVLYSFTPDGSTVSKVISWDGRGSYKWGTHPSNPAHLLLIMSNIAHLYEWHTLHRLTPDEGIILQGLTIPKPMVQSFTPCFNGTVFATVMTEPRRTHVKSKLLLWDNSDFNTESLSVTPLPRYQYLADDVELLIGTYGERLMVFLHSSGWVCSTDLMTYNIVRHFFIPADWLSINKHLMIHVSRIGDIIFVKRNEVAVVKRGLDTSEQGSYKTKEKRPPLAVPKPSY